MEFWAPDDDETDLLSFCGYFVKNCVRVGRFVGACHHYHYYCDWSSGVEYLSEAKLVDDDDVDEIWKLGFLVDYCES